MRNKPKPFKKDLAHGPWTMVTKQDAIRFQTDSAIVLYFHGRDFVSPHTLASAAVGILDPQLKAKGLPDTSGNLESIRPEYRGATEATLKEDANFFKHAAKDRSAELPFKPETNEFILIRCCDGYKRLTGEYTPTMLIFTCWMRLWRNDLFTKPFPEDVLSKMRSGYSRGKPKAFFDEFYPHIDFPEFLEPAGITWV